jgi:hypothetical protein
MKQRPKQRHVASRLLRRGGGSSPLHRKVKRMAAAGLVEDQIALRLGGLDKNQLRRRHIEALKQGRASRDAQKAQEAAEQPSREERERLERIELAFQSDWYSPDHGCDLYGGAHTVEEALEWCRRFKSPRDPNVDLNEPRDPPPRSARPRDTAFEDE